MHPDEDQAPIETPTHPVEAQAQTAETAEIPIEPPAQRAAPVLEIKFQNYEKEIEIDGLKFKVVGVDALHLTLKRQDILN